MRLVGGGFLALVLALAGCKGLAPKTADKDKKDNDPGAMASRPKGPIPAWLGDGSASPASATSARESQGLLAGRVFDPTGRGAEGVFIRIEPVDALPEEKRGAPISILTNASGEFLVRGLVTGRVYTLTAEAKPTRAGERPLAGQVQTRPPQANITIALRDDMALPPSAGSSPSASTTSLPPGSDRIPAIGLPAPSIGSGEWSPGAGSVEKSVPAMIPGTAPRPATPGLPPPMPGFPGDGSPGVRPDNTANGDPAPWRPPAVNIPGGPPVQSLPLPPPGNPSTPGVPPPGKQSSRPPANITLVDSLERPWNFARDRSGSLVMLEFVTTNCPHCVKAIPKLTALQSRYEASGLQLIGVLCDQGSRRDRATRAASYQREHNLNYAMYVEPGARAGAIADYFGIEAYPAVVLLNSQGAVVWKGHPGEKQLEAIIRNQLQSRDR
ncbi:MAG TPA: redoxin domain-containing protein [Urbifossiella sp.]|nr:redoxin domain-containing protein [Urbifossiella sp.]